LGIFLLSTSSIRHAFLADVAVAIYGAIGSGVSVITSLVLTFYIFFTDFPASESKDFDKLIIIFAIFTFYFLLFLFSRTKGFNALCKYWEKKKSAKVKWTEQTREKNSFIRKTSQEFKGYPLIRVSYYGATKRFADKVSIEFVHNENTLSQYVGLSVNKEAIKQGDIREDIMTLLTLQIIMGRTKAKTVYLTEGVLNYNSVPKVDFIDNLRFSAHPYNKTRLVIKAIKNIDTDGLNALEYANLVKLCEKKNSIQQKDIKKLVDYFANDQLVVSCILLNQAVTSEDIHHIFNKFSNEGETEGYASNECEDYLIKNILTHDNIGKETLAQILTVNFTCLNFIGHIGQIHRLAEERLNKMIRRDRQQQSSFVF